jgi:CheY-like chemotaxis protein
MSVTRRKETDEFVDYQVLLVEDNDINRALALHVLEKTGLQVDTAVNGQEALLKFLDAPTGFYDMIFMDIRMPVMDGYDATRQIRSLQREDSQLPIIALSANEYAEDASASQEAGMDEHVVKPLKSHVVYALLDKWLKCEYA